MGKRIINNFKTNRKALNDTLDDMIEHLEKYEDVINVIDLTSHFNMTNKYFSLISKSLENTTWKKEIIDKVDIIYDIVERRRLKKGETSRNPAWDIFILKAYHRKVEEQHIKTENKTENSGELNIKISYPTND